MAPPPADNEVSLDDLILLFNGRDENNLFGEGYKLAKAWLHEKENQKIKRAYACLTFIEKPPLYLITGVSKKDKDGAYTQDDNKGHLDDKIIKYLPVLTAIPKDDDSKTKRQHWGQFKLINMSMIRRVAFIAIEDKILPDNIKIVANFKARWGDTISFIDDTKPGWDKITGETLLIRKKQYTMFTHERAIVENA